MKRQGVITGTVQRVETLNRGLSRVTLSSPSGITSQVMVYNGGLEHYKGSNVEIETTRTKGPLGGTLEQRITTHILPGGRMPSRSMSVTTGPIPYALTGIIERL